MAWKLKYRCSQCGYEAEVYEGRGLFRQERTHEGLVPGSVELPFFRLYK